MTDSSAFRKARGAFFTPGEMTGFITDWAIRSGDDKILEPSCGEAAFLIPAARRLSALNPQWDRNTSQRLLNGVDVHAPSAAETARRLDLQDTPGNIIAADFFDIAPSPMFDAVVGNPPYIRYQNFSGPARIKAIEAALAHGVRLTGLASSWAGFTVHAAQFLKPGGRLGLVLPAELLTVNYAAEVRRFLLQRFASVRLITFEERVFPGVMEEVVLLLAEGEGPAPAFEVYQARALEDLDRIDRIGWTWFTPERGGKWTPALLPVESVEIYRDFVSNGGFSTLSDWGSTYLGSVTGNNRYFTLDADQVAALGLDHTEVLRISPPGSRHLRGLSFSDAAWKTLVRSGGRCYLFAPNPTMPSRAACRYIASGEATAVEKAYKCRNRRPWWRVPTVPVGDLLLTYMDHDRPRLTTNASGVNHLNSLYGVKLRPECRVLGRDLLPIASLNSLSLLGAEMVGRAYGGGMLKLEPKEADKLPVPSVAVLDAHRNELQIIRPQLTTFLRSGKLEEAIRLVDRVILTAALGMHPADIRAVRESREILFERRVSRNRGLSGAYR